MNDFKPIDLGDRALNYVVNLARAAADDSPVQWWYLSFVDTDRDVWLGGCYVDAPNVVMASVRAHDLGCNPGGEVATWGPFTADAVPASKRHRLLTRDEV